MPPITLEQPVVRSFNELARAFAGDFSFASDLSETQRRSFHEVHRAMTTYLGGSQGGYLLDWELAGQVFDKARAVDGPLQRCQFHRTTKHGFKLPGFDETSRVNGSRWGGIRAYWVGQEDDKTLSATTSTAGVAASQPSLNLVDFNLMRCLVYSGPHSNDLIDDAPMFGPMLDYAANQEIQYALVDKMINGTGMTGPLGVINAPSTVQVTRAGGAGTTTFAVADADSMWSYLWPFCKRNAVWHMSDATMDTVDAAARTGGWPASIYIPAGMYGNTYATIKGRPVIPLEQCPQLGQLGDIILGDWSQYLVCVRANVSGVYLEAELGPLSNTVEQMASDHKLFDTDSQVIRYKFRSDGKPMWRSSVTLADGSGQANSPFVILK